MSFHFWDGLFKTAFPEVKTGMNTAVGDAPEKPTARWAITVAPGPQRQQGQVLERALTG